MKGSSGDVKKSVKKFKSCYPKKMKSGFPILSKNNIERLEKLVSDIDAGKVKLV